MNYELDKDRGYWETSLSARVISDIKARYGFGKKSALELLPKENIVWLDIGANKGFGLSELNFDSKAVVLAIDIDKEYLNEAKKNNPEVSTLIMDGCMLGLNAGSVDSISCFEVIEHVSCTEATNMLREIYRVLKLGGVLILSTPNKGASGKRRTSPDHQHEYTPQEMDYLLKNSGFGIVDMLGQGFIKEENLFSKIYRGARDSYLASFIYYNILPTRIRLKIRDGLQNQLQGDVIRNPKDNETPKNLFYVCQKK